MNKNSFIVLAVMMTAFFTPFIFAQNGVFLNTEIQDTERLAGNPGISALERHDALVRLARLRQLSGDIEGAAKNWLEAAAAIPGQVDDDALYACAVSLAAMGEWNRALTALEPLTSKSIRANFLSIGINAINDGDVSRLSEIASSPEYSQMNSEICYLLWRLSIERFSDNTEAEMWRTRLVSEYPQSPEGKLASGVNTAVSLMPNPFWLFIGGLDSLPLVNVDAAAQASVIQNISAARLQTGLYSQETNAKAQAAKLTLAGFTPSVEKRLTGSAEMWAVTVSAGTDANRTIGELREKGFDSFLLR